MYVVGLRKFILGYIPTISFSLKSRSFILRGTKECELLLKAGYCTFS